MLLGDLAGGIEPADAGDSIDQLEQLELVDGAPPRSNFSSAVPTLGDCSQARISGSVALPSRRS